MVLGMPLLKAVNPVIDFQYHNLKFSNGYEFLAVLVNPEESRPSVSKVLAKTVVKWMYDQGIVGWFALVRGPDSVQIVLFAFADLAADPPIYLSLLHEFCDIFDTPRAPLPQPVAHYIDLLKDIVRVPHHCAYGMSSSELAKSRCYSNDILQKGWIQLSCSLYGALLLLLRKKTG